MIPDSEIDRVRESADIVGILGEYVELRRMGADFRGPCPFHQGKNRNFSVSASKRMYYCFVCHESGDVFTFLQKRLGLDWPGAVRLVAEKSGLELREVRSARQDGPDPREPLWEANAAAAEYFQRYLWEQPGAASAREYLEQRHIDRETAERFGLGFAPREIGLMRAHLISLGIADERQLEVGLLVRRAEEEEPRPRFRQRVTFPIHDVSGRCVGFGGRLIGPGEPKYLNSAESPVYSKGEMLYNLNRARLAARKEERIFVVEGYFDAIRLAAAGVDCVVAPLGTALTESQAALVTRYAKHVFLLYDSDKAGLRATFRAGDILLTHQASVRVITLPAGEDPDTFVQRHGKEALERLTADSIDVFDRKVQLLERGGWFADLHKRRQAVDHLLPTIRACADPVLRDLYLARAASATGVDRLILQREVEAGAKGRSPDRRPAGKPPGHDQEQAAQREAPKRARRRVSPAHTSERELVRIMLVKRAALGQILEHIGPEDFQEPDYQEIFRQLRDQGEEATVEMLAASLSADDAETMQQLLAEPDAIQDEPRTIVDSLARLDQRRLERRNKDIDAEIRVATDEEKDRLIREKTVNQGKIAQLREGREQQH